MYHHSALQEIDLEQPMLLPVEQDKFSKVKTGVTKLFLSNFRNYEHLEIYSDLAPIVLCGTNGSGKTNLLESLSFLIPGRGLRRAKLSEVTCSKADEKFPWAVCADIKAGSRDFQVGTGLDVNHQGKQEKRIVKIDGKILKGQSNLGDVITAVWLTPEMDRLFRGSPSGRRRFLDRLVYAYDPVHASRLTSYENALKQWLFILRSQNRDPIWLGSLEETLAAKSVSIAAARKEMVSRLNHITKAQNSDFPIAVMSLEGMVETMLDDKPASSVEDYVKQFFEKSRRQVLENQFVTEGIHRTDVKAFYVQKNVEASNCSTGEQKAILISIIMAQASSMVKVLGKAPILLLDEIVAHLDEGRRNSLFASICDLGLQAWLTGTDEESFSYLRNKGQFFKVDNAKVTSL